MDHDPTIAALRAEATRTQEVLRAAQERCAACAPDAPAYLDLVRAQAHATFAHLNAVHALGQALAADHAARTDRDGAS